MSNKDFQNGFIAGYASNNGSSSLNEEYITQQFQNFKEKEIDYVRIYAYDTEQLGSKPELKGKNVFRTDSYIANNVQGGVTLSKSIWYFFELAIAKKSSLGDVKVLLESPMKLDRNETYGTMVLTNTEEIIDCGFKIRDNSCVFFEEELNKEYVDGENILKVYISYDDQSEVDYDGDEICYLRCHLHIDVADKLIEGVPLAEILKQEFDGMLENFGPIFAIKFKNTPEVEIIEASYIGGN